MRTLLLLLLFCGLSASNTLSAQACDHPDFAALMAFYDSTNGPGWDNNTGWIDGAAGTNCDPCSGWAGITCINERVDRISMSGNELTGFIPEEISGLTQLTFLNIWNNELSGPIPDGFYQLMNLRYINLEGMSLTGGISELITNLQELEYFRVSYNEFTAPLPAGITTLTNLRVLMAHQNHITGEIPADIGNMQSLEELHLWNNELSGTIPPSIGSLANLVTIILTRNQLTGEIPNEFTNLTELKTARIGLNNLTGSIPELISNMINLEVLSVSDNQLTGTIPESIGNLPELTTLLMDKNELSGNIPDAIGQLQKLEYFYGEYNSFTGTLPVAIEALPLLKQLRLTSNNLEGPLPDFVSLDMEAINLRNNDFTGEIPASYTYQEELYLLFLDGNNLTGTVPEGFGNLPDPPYILAGGNNLSGCLPEDLRFYCDAQSGIPNFFGNPLMPNYGSFSAFCNLTPDETQIGAPCDDGIPDNGPDVINDDCSCGDYVPPVVCDHPDYEALAEFYSATDGDNWTSNTGWLTDCEPCNWEGVFCAEGTRVTHLYLNNHNVNGEIIPAVLGITELQELALEGNQLTGPVDDEIYDLPNLRLLALSNNPGIDVGSLLTGASTSLEELILRGCGFGQVIPDINELPNLTRLNLAHNGITGIINPTIYALQNLELLGLNSNAITGIISPDIGQLSNLISINVGTNQLQGGIPTEIGDLANLEGLFAFNNPLGGTLPNSMTNLLNLRFLNLAQAEIIGEIPAGIGLLPDLEMVELWKNGFTGEIPAGFGDIVSLVLLRLDNNQLSGCIPFDLQQKCNLPAGSVQLNDNPLLPWQGDFSQFCATPDDQVGASCDAGGDDDVIDNDCTCGPAITCDHPDYEALVEFYHDLSGENWNNNDGWLTDCEPCNWAGITCNGNNRVTRISLPNNNLVGLIPAATANLTFLRNLNIPNSDIDGPLPYFFADHPNLRRINFNYCYFSGGIPPEFGEIPHLRFLLLRGNQLNGTIAEELGDLDFIRLIDARDNQLQGPLDENLEGMLNTLQYLNLSNNNLRGCYPEELNDLCLVDFVDLSNNPLLPWQGDIVQYCNNPDGQVGASCDAGGDDDIILDNCSCGPDPTCNHPDYAPLEAFYQATNGDNWTDNTGWLTDCEPCNWAGITCTNGRVTRLILPNNNLTGPLPAAMADLTFLGDVYLLYNNLNGPLPDFFAGSSSMKFLRIGFNDFSGPVSEEMGQIINLRWLDLQSNALTGELPESFGDLENLQMMSFRNNDLTGSVPAAYGQLSATLTWLDLRSNNLSGCLEEPLMDLCGATNVSLSGNPLLPWQGNFQNFCDGLDQEGASCDDGMVQTQNDFIDFECVCSGVIYQEENCDEKVGSPCDDGDPKTKGEVILSDCSCGLQGKALQAVNTREELLRVFPNPSQGVPLTVILPVKSATLRLLTPEGREIYRMETQSERASVPVSGFKPGLYLLAVDSKERTWVRKVVIR